MERRSSGRVRRSELKRLRSSGRVRAVTPPPSGEPVADALFEAMVPDPGLSVELGELRQEVLDLRRLQEVIHFLGGAPDLVTLRRELLDLALSVSGLSRGMLALRVSTDDALTHKYKVKATRGFEDDARRAPEVKVLRRMLNRALEARETLIEGDVQHGGILGHAHAGGLRLRAVACLPLEAGGELLGALVLDDPDRRGPFTKAQQSLLRSFARHAALALLRVAQVHRLGRRATLLKRRTERVEAERDAALARLDAARRQRPSGAAPVAAPDAEAARRPASRDALDALVEQPYRDAKEAFTRRFLEQAMRRAGGDLRMASAATGLPIARLIGLLTRLDVSAGPRDGEAPWGSAVKAPR
ncbi:MAG: GAF domain-containing protein [Planctomycetes bacterium]|nr:GAF domain-containing protein [Planctomycetota bacterium]